MLLGLTEVASVLAVRAMLQDTLDLYRNARQTWRLAKWKVGQHNWWRTLTLNTFKSISGTRATEILFCDGSANLCDRRFYEMLVTSPILVHVPSLL